MKSQVKLYIVNDQREAKEVGTLEAREIKLISFGNETWEIHVVYKDGNVHIYPADQFTEVKASEYTTYSLMNLGTI